MGSNPTGGTSPGLRTGPLAVSTEHEDRLSPQRQQPAPRERVGLLLWSLADQKQSTYAVSDQLLFVLLTSLAVTDHWVVVAGQLETTCWFWSLMM